MITPLLPLVEKKQETQDTSKAKGWDTPAPPNPHANCTNCTCSSYWGNVGSISGTDYYF